MTKTHFCKKITDFKECKETDPSKFEKNRYSICRECRKILTKEKRNLKISNEKNNSLVQYQGISVVAYLDKVHKELTTVVENKELYTTSKQEINKGFEVVTTFCCNLNEFIKNEIKDLRSRQAELDEKQRSIEKELKRIGTFLPKGLGLGKLVSETQTSDSTESFFDSYIRIKSEGM